jgi:(1->4)-alpha-D-glucan 1-alpha-D-glucosylmutase
MVREQTNYRRFFDVSDLICLRVEDPAVFEASHALILALAREAKVTGLRIDHVDGLLDPLGYLRRLQHRIGATPDGEPGPPRYYVVVEKILDGDEALPHEWPVCGTTGYEFARAVNGVFVDRQGIKRLDAITAAFTGSRVEFADVVYQAKKQVVAELFGAELGVLGQSLVRLARGDRHAQDLSPQGLSQALVEATACLPVYRTYIRGFVVSREDHAVITAAIAAARRRRPDLGLAPFVFLQRVLLLDLPGSLPSAVGEEWLTFVRRWQLFTGPVAAKGLEDTALYRYSRLLSLNEVGGDPGAERSSVEDFHRHNLATRKGWPRTLNATSTHDTKRSEDVRTRIGVLSELPAAWAKHLKRWSRWNRWQRRRIDGQPIPDADGEIFLYQTLIGAWPLSPAELPAFRRRLEAYAVKAAREAKVHTNWMGPNAAVEEALVAFIRGILRRSTRNRFLRDFLRFQGEIGFYGAFNALGQVLLKIASSGIPDVYQGTELWDFSLVDPDNRRPLDFGKRQRLLEELQRRAAEDPLGLTANLLAHWTDGRIKLFVTWKGLTFRRSQAALFLDGAYLPLAASGARKRHVCAFARRLDAAWAVVAVPRLLTRLVKVGVPPCGEGVWRRGGLILAREAPERWRNVLTGETIRSSQARGERVLPLKSVFAHFPVALLSGVQT